MLLDSLGRCQCSLTHNVDTHLSSRSKWLNSTRLVRREMNTFLIIYIQPTILVYSTQGGRSFTFNTLILWWNCFPAVAETVSWVSPEEWTKGILHGARQTVCLSTRCWPESPGFWVPQGVLLQFPLLRTPRLPTLPSLLLASPKQAWT